MTGKPHTVRLRMDADLYIHLQTICSNHLDGQAELNSPGAPTQALVDAWLSQGNRINDEAQRAEDRLRKTVGEAGMSVLDEIKLDL